MFCGGTLSPFRSASDASRDVKTQLSELGIESPPPGLGVKSRKNSRPSASLRAGCGLRCRRGESVKNLGPCKSPDPALLGSEVSFDVKKYPLSALERRDTYPSHSSKRGRPQSEEVEEAERLTRLQDVIYGDSNRSISDSTIESIRKRGLDEIGRLLSSRQSQKRTTDERRRDKELLQQIHTTHRLPFKCLKCSSSLTYLYMSTQPNNARQVHEILRGDDPPNVKMQNLLPPLCTKCQSFILFDNAECRWLMMENFDEWVDTGLTSQSDEENEPPVNIDCSFDPRNAKLIVMNDPGQTSRVNVRELEVEVDSTYGHWTQTPRSKNISPEENDSAQFPFNESEVQDMVNPVFSDLSSLTDNNRYRCRGPAQNEGTTAEPLKSVPPSPTQTEIALPPDSAANGKETMERRADGYAIDYVSDDDPFSELEDPDKQKKNENNRQQGEAMASSSSDEQPQASSETVQEDPISEYTKSDEADEASQPSQPLNSYSSNSLGIVNTNSEERAILNQYSMKKHIAARQFAKDLRKGHELTVTICLRCQMPMMVHGDELKCVSCPAIHEKAKKIADQKRRVLSTIQRQIDLPADVEDGAESKDDLSALEGGFLECPSDDQHRTPSLNSYDHEHYWIRHSRSQSGASSYGESNEVQKSFEVGQSTSVSTGLDSQQSRLQVEAKPNPGSEPQVFQSQTTTSLLSSDFQYSQSHESSQYSQSDESSDVSSVAQTRETISLTQPSPQKYHHSIDALNEVANEELDLQAVHKENGSSSTDYSETRCPRNLSGDMIWNHDSEDCSRHTIGQAKSTLSSEHNEATDNLALSHGSNKVEGNRLVELPPGRHEAESQCTLDVWRNQSVHGEAVQNTKIQRNAMTLDTAAAPHSSQAMHQPLHRSLDQGGSPTVGEETSTTTPHHELSSDTSYRIKPRVQGCTNFEDVTKLQMDDLQPTEPLQSHMPDFDEVAHYDTVADQLEMETTNSVGDESLGARIARLADSLKEVAEQLPLQQIYQGIDHHKSEESKSEESFSDSERNRIAHISQAELLLKLESTSRELEETVMQQFDVQYESGPPAPQHQPPTGRDDYDLHNLPSLFSPTPPRHSPIIQDLRSYAQDSVPRSEGHGCSSPHEYQPLSKPDKNGSFSIDTVCLLDNERSNIQGHRRQTCLPSHERMLGLTSSEGSRSPDKLSTTTSQPWSQPSPPLGSRVYGISVHDSPTPKSSNKTPYVAFSADRWGHLPEEQPKSADPPGKRVGSFEGTGVGERVGQRSDPPECQEQPEYHFSTPKSRKRSQHHAARFDTTDSRDPPDSTEKDRIATTRLSHTSLGVLRHPPSPTRRREQPSRSFSSQKFKPSLSRPSISPVTKPNMPLRRSTHKSRKELKLSIPSWIGKDIKQSDKPLLSPGESSMDRLFRTIDEIEDDFESIISSMPGSQDQSSLTCGTEEGNRGGFLSRTERPSDFGGTAGIEACSFGSHESDDIAITQHVTSRIQKIKDCIGRTNSADSGDGSENYESEGEMTELMNRLTRAAENLKTFHDHWDD